MLLNLHSVCFAMILVLNLPHRAQFQRSTCRISGYTQRSAYVWQNRIEKKTNCIQECLSDGKSSSRDTNSPQYMYEGKFLIKRTAINCDVSVRQFSFYCNYFLKKSALSQSGTRRYFFSTEIEATFFEAQKACRKRGLTLGTTDIKSKEVEVISLIRSAGNVTEKGRTFWGENRAANSTYRKDNKTSICSGFSIDNDTIVKVEENCKTKALFFCDVSVYCYTESCISGTGVITKADPTRVLEGTTCLLPQCDKTCSSKDLMVAEGGENKYTCGKAYFVVKKEVTQEEAFKYCCAKKMNLLTIETEDDLTCVTELFKGKDVSGKEELEFWTSASDSGCPGRFAWCSSVAKAIPKWFWSESELVKNKGCAVATLLVPEESEAYGEVSLVKKDCSTKAFFICSEETESKLSNTHKACNHKCENNNCTLKSIGGSFNFRAGNPGVSGPIKTVCGHDYYIGKTKRGWKASEDSCCEDRMELVQVDTPEEIECLRELMAVSGDTWRGGPYWVGGTDQGCPLNFAWCSATEKMPFSVRNQRTMKVNNRKSGSCIAIDLNPQKTVLNAFKCDQTYRYICRDPRSCLPRCPQRSPCGPLYKNTGASRVKRQVADDDDDDDDDEKVSVTGVFQNITACQKKYLISEDQLNVYEAMAQCCNQNARLLATDQKNEGECLFGILRTRSGGANFTSFWTSGTDFDCKGQFVWCSTGELFSALETPRTVLTAGDKKDCLALEVDFRRKSYSIKDELCSLRLKFICEVNTNK